MTDEQFFAAMEENPILMSEFHRMIVSHEGLEYHEIVARRRLHGDMKLMVVRPETDNDFYMLSWFQDGGEMVVLACANLVDDILVPAMPKSRFIGRLATEEEQGTGALKLMTINRNT